MLRKIKEKLDAYKIGNQERIAWQNNYDSAGLLKMAHSLKKGMVFPVVKYGYGLEKANKLLKNLKRYKATGQSENSFAYLESLYILQTYVTYQLSEGIALENLV